MPHSWLEQQIAAANQGKIGLIDIGSNSIRMVVYDRLKRAPSAIYNEKVMCQLGKGLALDGKLNPDGVKLAHKAIARFISLAKNMEVTELDIVATAAVREASDGQTFVDELERAHNIHIEVLSGKREAKLGAYGILSSMHEPVGIAGDLGGGSLELVALDKQQRIGERISLPIGVLRLLDECDSPEAIRDKTRAILQKESWLSQQQGQTFYAIGGSFRNLARIHSLSTNYPLPLTHGYTIKTKDTSKLLKRVSSASPSELADMAGISTKRIPVLPAAAIMMDELLRLIQPSHITFSSSGIREGYLYEKLSPFIREEDVLIASCIELPGTIYHSRSYAGELFEWMQGMLHKQSQRSMRVAYSACLLQDIARYILPDHRGEWAFERIMQSNLHGIDHQQRVQLALTLYHRYRFKRKHAFAELTLLSDKHIYWAELVGSIASLAHHLTGGIAGTLPRIKLEIKKQRCALILPDNMQSLDGDVIHKRLSAIEASYAHWQTTT